MNELNKAHVYINVAAVAQDRRPCRAAAATSPHSGAAAIMPSAWLTERLRLSRPHWGAQGDVPAERRCPRRAFAKPDRGNAQSARS
jgi:hypothetical protein